MFIELTKINLEEKVTVGTHHIVYFVSEPLDNTTWIQMNGSSYGVTETYEQVKQLIKESLNK